MKKLKSRLAELGWLAFQNRKAKVTMKDGEVFECRPVTLVDSDEDDEEGFTIDAYLVRMPNGGTRILMETDIRQVDEA